jgi:hypothetical protein
MIACDGPNRALCSTAQNTNDIGSYQGSIGTTQFGVFNLEQPIDNEQSGNAFLNLRNRLVASFTFNWTPTFSQGQSPSYYQLYATNERDVFSSNQSWFAIGPQTQETTIEIQKN